MKLLIAAFLVVLVGVALRLVARRPSGLRAEYHRDVAQGLARTVATPLLTEADLAALPAAVQGYIRLNGAVGQPRVQNFRARFHGQVRSGPAARWMSFTGEQHDVYDQPSRLFLMDATMFGIPFLAFHRFVGPSATMRVKILSIFKMVDAADRLSGVRGAPGDGPGRVRVARACRQVCVPSLRVGLGRVQRGSGLRWGTVMTRGWWARTRWTGWIGWTGWTRLTGRVTLTAAALGVLVLAAACSDSTSPPHPAKLPLMPLAVGNHWDYRLFEVHGDTVELGTYHLELVRTVELAGITYYSTSSGALYGARGDSLSVSGCDSSCSALQDFEYLFRYPIDPGSSYFYRTPYIPGAMVFWIDARMDTVSTPLGRLPTLIYSVNAGRRMQYGFTPGIGLTYWRSPWGPEIILTSYSLVPG